MYPFLRLGLELALARARRPLPLDGVHVSRHTCWPWDIDPWGELNNGRTLTLYDLGRVPLAVRTGLVAALRRNGWGLAVAGASVRYRRRVRAFERLEMRSAFVGRDPRFLYVHQAMFRGGEAVSARADPQRGHRARRHRADRPGVAGARPRRTGRRRCPPGSRPGATPRPAAPGRREISTALAPPPPPAAASSPGCSSTGRTSRSRPWSSPSSSPPTSPRGDRRPGARPGALGHRRPRSAASIVAVLAPLLGAIADRTGARKAWVLAFSLPYLARLPRLLARGARRCPTRRSVLAAYVLAFLGSEFGTVFTNAMLPGLAPAPRDRPHLRLRLGARLPRRPRLAGPRAALARPGARRQR